MAETSKKEMFEKLTPALMVVTVVLAFIVGVLWNKVSTLEGGGLNLAANNNGNAAGAVAPPTSGKLSADQAEKLAKVSKSDHIRGSQGAKVFLIEYSDLECPYCEQFHSTAKRAVDEYGDEFAWVYRHFPLDSIHPKARPAAIAAECVAKAGGDEAFWEFIDGVFANQLTALSNLENTASDLGFDIASCLSSKETEDVIDANYEGGSNAGVTGTPGNFIVNDKGEVWTLPGAVPYETLKSAIDEALQS